MTKVDQTIQKIVGETKPSRNHNEQVLKLLKRVVSHITIRNAMGQHASEFCVKCQRDGHKDCPMGDMKDMIEEIEKSQ